MTSVQIVAIRTAKKKLDMAFGPTELAWAAHELCRAKMQAGEQC